MGEPGPCIFPGCVSRDRHWHGGFPGGYDDPADTEGPPIEFTTEPAPGVRDYNGALLPPIGWTGPPMSEQRDHSAGPPEPRAAESPHSAASQARTLAANIVREVTAYDCDWRVMERDAKRLAALSLQAHRESRRG